MDLPIYKVIFDEESEMIINSLVDIPAHLRYFIAQNGKSPLKFSINEEKREITGVVISANQPVYYYSKEIPECYMVFDPPTIKRIAMSYLGSNKSNLIDIQHDFRIRDGAITMIESYLTDEYKRSPFDVEYGSWIMTYKVNDNDLWEKIKSGKINGYSIAGNFNLEKLEFNYKIKNQKKSKAMTNLKEKILALFEAETKEIKMKEIITVDGKKMKAAEDLVEGAKLYAIAEDGTEILAPKGEYIFEVDGKSVKVIVNEIGVIVGVEDIQVTQATPETPAVPDFQKEIENLKNEISNLKSEIEKIKKEMEDSITTVATEMAKKIKFSFPKPEEAEKENKIKIRV